MRKLKLDVDALQVEEFATVEPRAAAQGSVRGHDESYSQCYCPQSYQDLSCYSNSADDVCDCVITTKL
ncbi:MAG TPA: hypothetical protein VLK84_30050, partial [Longimicrobium sp.]|nr:hypothetical protein [Longimicrobium sp.]